MKNLVFEPLLRFNKFGNVDIYSIACPFCNIKDALILISLEGRDEHSYAFASDTAVGSSGSTINWNNLEQYEPVQTKAIRIYNDSLSLPTKP